MKLFLIIVITMNLIGCTNLEELNSKVNSFVNQQSQTSQNTTPILLNEVVQEQQELKIPDGISFGKGNSVLSSTFYESLDLFARQINSNDYKEYQILIYGFTDNVEAIGFEGELSKERAKIVKDYLTSRGVNPERVIVRGYGGKEYISSNETPMGKALNRRVEIKVIPKLN